MIDLSTIESIAPHIDPKRKLVPVPGSTLASLTLPLIDKCNYQLTLDEEMNGAELDMEGVVKLVSDSSYDDPAYTNLHQDLLDKATKDIARIMSNNIFLARTVTLPLIDTYTERLTNVVSEKCNRSTLALNVIEDSKRAILASPQLKEIVRDQANRTNYVDIKLPRYHANDVPLPELRRLVVTGNSSFDEIIDAWIQAGDLESSLKTVYNDVFASSKSSYTEFTKYINTSDYQRSILALLLCWGLVKNPQEGISKALSDYKKEMEIFASACSGMISQAISSYERGVRNNNLVLQYPVRNRQFCFDAPEKNCIIVDPSAYREFLELGGSPEILFGSYLTGDRALNSQALLAEGEKYIKEYKRQTARGRLASINNVLDIVRKELRAMAFDVVQDMASSNDEPDGLTKDYELTFKGSSHMERVKRFIDTVSDRDIEDYYGLVRRFICGCFFEGSMVGALLDKIDALDPDNNQDINELAIVATTDLIVDWLLTQIETDTSSVSLEGFYIK